MSNGAGTRDRRYSTAAAQIRARYKYKAESKGVEFNLTAAQFARVIVKNCVYCGRSARKSKTASTRSRQGHIPYNGIDRIDPRQGYEPWNVAPCCFDCNRAKGAMSVKEFQQWIRRIYAKQYR